MLICELCAQSFAYLLVDSYSGWVSQAVTIASTLVPYLNVAPNAMHLPILSFFSEILRYLYIALALCKLPLVLAKSQNTACFVHHSKLAGS